MNPNEALCAANSKASMVTAFDTFKAFTTLVLIDLAVRLGGFPLLYKIVKRWPVARASGEPSHQIRRVCGATDKAGSYYFKTALCLQRSAVAACMLRSRGIAAIMVIGCRIMPYQGHAWVEVEGRVVNDKPEVQQNYQVLDRV